MIAKLILKYRAFIFLFGLALLIGSLLELFGQIDLLPSEQEPGTGEPIPIATFLIGKILMVAPSRIEFFFDTKGVKKNMKARKARVEQARREGKI